MSLLGQRRMGSGRAVVLALLGLASVGASAEGPDLEAPRAVVEGFHAVLIDVMKEARDLGYDERYRRLEPVVRQSFDISSMARRTLGEHWKALSPDDQKRWLDTFDRFHISATADIRQRYRGQQYRTLGAEPTSENEVLVHTQLDYPGRNVDLFTDYRLRKGPLGWRIVDVHAPPSVSQVAMWRAEYGVLFANQGFEKLLATMEAKIIRRERS